MIIDLSTLNKSVVETQVQVGNHPIRPVVPQTGDWTVSLDLQDTYLQIPIHQESLTFLRFITKEGSFQFKVLPFGLTTPSQVVTRVMAPASVIVHYLNTRLPCYLND